MSKKNEEFTPKWCTEAPPAGSYRSILKWGDPNEFKHPNPRLYALMKKTFNMTDEDFKKPQKMGLEQVNYDIKCKMCIRDRSRCHSQIYNECAT